MRWSARWPTAAPISMLNGELNIHGAKNSVLPILAATILADGVSQIHNCPRLSDVKVALEILEHLGCKMNWEEDVITVDSSTMNRYDIPESLMSKMRSSVMFLGAILSRMRTARISTPGGCEIGLRPIDLHISSLTKLGADISFQNGCIVCNIKDKIKGAPIILSIPSVGATENIMLAAACSEGETTIINPAKEPEIEDLQNALNSMGAKIYGAGSSAIYINGVKKLNGMSHKVMPDRIAASTYMCAFAVCGGKGRLNNVNPQHFQSVTSLLRDAGCEISEQPRSVQIISKGVLNPLKNVRTMPYPGFPTDAQAPLMACMSLAEGTSVFVETIFENRYKHVNELLKMGAKIKVEGRVAVVDGVPRLSCAKTQATDLRGGAALVIAALAAEGKSEISNLGYIDRGYENIEIELSSLGAVITRKG